MVIIYLKKKNANKIVDEVPQFSEDGVEDMRKQKDTVHNITEENISEVVVFDNITH
jgi:hypothetical protein